MIAYDFYNTHLKRTYKGKFMINALKMNITLIGKDLNFSGDSKTTLIPGESPFAGLMKNLNGSAKIESSSFGSSIQAGKSDSCTTNPVNSLNKSINNSDQDSFQTSDLLLPKSAWPNLQSLLENKGFSVDQIEDMLLSSQNDEGLIQTQKLVAAMYSIISGKSSVPTGLIMQEDSVPKLEKFLFGMGLDEGEAKEIIDQSYEQGGIISLDKLSDELKQHDHGLVSKYYLINLLEQKDISVTQEANDIADIGPEKNMIISLLSHNPADGSKNIAGSIFFNIDINKTALEFKKEFMDFGDHSVEHINSGVNFSGSFGFIGEINDVLTDYLMKAFQEAPLTCATNFDGK